MTARILVVLAMLMGTAAAQKQQPAYRLELKKAPNLDNGKAAAAKGKARATPDQFFVENIGVLQPVVVTLIAKKKGDKVTMHLGKYDWNEKLREATTDASGQTTVKLRTQGELRISVTANDSEPLPYMLFVWVGDEVKPEMKNVTVSMTEYKKKQGGGGGATGKIIGVSIAAAIVAAFALVIRRRLRGAK